MMGAELSASLHFYSFITVVIATFLESEKELQSNSHLLAVTAANPASPAPSISIPNRQSKPDFSLHLTPTLGDRDQAESPWPNGISGGNASSTQIFKYGFCRRHHAVRSIKQ